MPPTPAANTVRIGAATYPLAGINPTAASNPPGALFPPGYRGADQMVAYQAPVSVTPTNMFGAEVPVVAGKVTAVNDRQATADTRGTPVPQGGGVLSGHGAARDWLLAHATAGATVELVYVAPVPVPPVPTSGASNISTWVMLWSNSPAVDIGTLPLEIDEVRLAFLNGTGQSVGDGPYGLAALRAQLQGFLGARTGRRISASIGGGGYNVDLSSVATFAANMKAREVELGITWGGLNCDVETQSFAQQSGNYVALARQFKAERPGFYCSWSPNGTYRTDYQSVLQGAPDVVDELAFQDYDTVVDYGTALQYVQAFMGGGKLDASQVGVGMMIEDGNPQRWTLAQCIDYATRIKAATGVVKFNVWEASRPGLAAWAKAMRQIASTP